VCLLEAGDGGSFCLAELSCLDGKVTVGLEEFVFRARLEPVPSDTWYRENLRVEGDDAGLLREDLLEQGTVEILFPRGTEGSQVVVTLTSVVLPGRQDDKLTVTMRRACEPRATLEVWERDVWRPVNPGEVLTERPLRLRIRFSRDMRKDTVEPFLLMSPPGHRPMPWDAATGGPAPGEIVWPDDRTLLWTLTDPPPLLLPNVRQARDVDGLWVLGGLPAVYTGEPPWLCIRDPVTGREDRVLTVPTDIRKARIAPDGQSLLVWGFAVCTCRSGPRPVTGVIDLITGRWRELDPDWAYVGWTDEGTLVRIKAGRYQVIEPGQTVVYEGTLPEVDRMWFPTLSCDGSQLAFLVESASPSGEKQHLMDLGVVELTTGQVTWTRDFTSHQLPPTSARESLSPLAWSPDGLRVAGLADLAEGTAMRVLDRKTGTVHTAVVIAGETGGSEYRAAWSPTGQYWLIGRWLVGTTAPHVITRVFDFEPEWWSPDGRQVAGGGWEGARLCHVETGAVEELGPVLPCGWDRTGRLYLIRWPDAVHRYIHYEP